jgi:two-component system OmpR family sensor kinase
MRPWSLINDLKWRQLGLLAGLWLVGAVIASAFVMHETNEMFDNAMAEAANAVLAIGEPSPSGGLVNMPRVEAVALSSDRRKYMSFQIRDLSGNVLARSRSAPVEPYPVSVQLGYTGAGTMRYLTRPLPTGSGVVQIAEFYDERRDAFLGLLAGFSGPLLALLAIGGIVISRSVGRAGKPIAELSRQLQARNGANMNLIDHSGMPIELEPIVDDVNRLLTRLDDAFEAERAFSANCAHELRNPIAAAQAQIEYLAMFPGDPANIERIKSTGTSLSELGHRIERLLQLSRAEAGTGTSSQSSDLIAVTQLLIDDYVRRGKAVDFDRGPTPQLAVAIDKDAVGIAVQNLIDNALSNASSGSRVEVRVDASGALHVVNSCAAVAPGELSRLTQRFQRDRSSKIGGYGLGLAIVGELMRQTVGRLELKSPATGRPDGFEAIMWLPAAPVAAAAE